MVEALRSYLPGWKRYFSLADTPRVFHNLDAWMRRRLRLVHLKQWKQGATVFRELRSGVTTDGKTKVKSPSGTLSTAEAISVLNSGLAMAGYYGDGTLKADDLAAGLIGAIVKDPVQDRVVWLEYLQTVVKEREGWKDLYRACQEVLTPVN